MKVSMASMAGASSAPRSRTRCVVSRQHLTVAADHGLMHPRRSFRPCGWSGRPPARPGAAWQRRISPGLGPGPCRHTCGPSPTVSRWSTAGPGGGASRSRAGGWTRAHPSWRCWWVGGMMRDGRKRGVGGRAGLQSFRCHLAGWDAGTAFREPSP
ncbi:hypothetical protein BO71DRAFT_93318 [Aspergillus ellipticus CBS 707.79]|uniref:Uncharacterized protein n=1 Tax=Aspergillus ellipticus CBS 707.79 TaxID=1448320 RepID=A0A319EGA6_9EURO|nr:hypothetical protein BO71DRAFT_93318 [Aspergillus ellipticus CBS 707.79]